MKKILFVLAVLLTLNYSCSRKDHIIIPSSSPHPLIEYTIDLNFTINPSCSIRYDSTDDYEDYFYLIEKDFEFTAGSDSNLPYDTSGSYIRVFQNYSYYTESYSLPQFDVKTKNQNSTNFFIVQPVSRDFNLFTLPFLNDTVSFSGTCKVIGGAGKYQTIGFKTQPLTFSGVFDLAHDTGSFRIKGSVYLQQ